jgi:hypothetical protein
MSTQVELQVRAFGAQLGSELHKIVDMLVVIGPNAWQGGGDLFTCRHWDLATKLCKEYDDRPKYLCGAYPYKGICYWCWGTDAPKMIGDPTVVWPVVDDATVLLTCAEPH